MVCRFGTEHPDHGVIPPLPIPISADLFTPPFIVKQDKVFILAHDSHAAKMAKPTQLAEGFSSRSHNLTTD